MKDIYIYGGGGHCFALIELIRSNQLYLPKVIFDAKPSTNDILGIPVNKHNGDTLNLTNFAIGIGNNRSRQSVSQIIHGVAPNLIHKSAILYESTSIGNGVHIFPNAVVDADVNLGNFVIINNNSTVSHNTVIGDFCHIAINAAVSGGCVLGEGVFVGAGSVILPEINIGKWAIIGAGAVVIENVPEGATVVGNPARILEK